MMDYTKTTEELTQLAIDAFWSNNIPVEKLVKSYLLGQSLEKEYPAYSANLNDYIQIVILLGSHGLI